MRGCHRLLSLIMKSAMRERLILINPCEGVRLPPRRRKDTHGVTLTQEEVDGKLLPEIPERYRALVGTAAYTGLRWGECAGLAWDVVDLDKGRLRVVRVLVEVSGHITAKPYPKSAAGRRLVPVPPPLVELLREHRASYPSGGLVFTNTAGGPVGRTSFRTQHWKPALRRAGLPEHLRFHDLRHAYATWLVSDGLPPNIVQRIMGHEDVTTTLGIYTDVPADFLNRAAKLFEPDDSEDGAEPSVVDPLSEEAPEDPEDADSAPGDAP